MTAFIADFAMKSQLLDISYMLLVSGQGSKEYCEVVNTVYANSHGQLQAQDTRHHKVKNGNRKHINLVERISCTVPVAFAMSRLLASFG